MPSVSGRGEWLQGSSESSMRSSVDITDEVPFGRQAFDKRTEVRSKAQLQVEVSIEPGDRGLAQSSAIPVVKGNPTVPIAGEQHDR